MNSSPLAEEMLRIARLAAIEVARIRAAGFQVHQKGPNDPVTDADRAANDLLLRELARSFPGEAVIAEESAPTEQAEIERLLGAPRAFFVDPIDGTREFADGIDEWCVMLGLAEGSAKLGVLVMPDSSALVGEPGIGAFEESASGARREVRVDDVSDPRAARMMVSRSHPSKTAERVAGVLGVAGRIPCGSVGVKVARVATGVAQIYVHGGLGIKKWDLCAPDAVLRGASGCFTDLAGVLHDYRSPGLRVKTGLAATNARLHDAVLAAARE